MVKTRKFVVAKLFQGEIKDGDLVIEEEEVPSLQENECLIEALYLSVDPYMRAYSGSYRIGQTMIGSQVAKVVESKSDKYPVGAVVVANVGWRTHSILPKDNSEMFYILPELGNLPVSLGLGVLGMPGATAYFGFLDICRPKENETVVVTGAAGAVGSHVGQIAKIKGCKVIGLTGSKEKVEWLKSLGFDHVINYKTVTNLEEALKEAAPNGVDCYFDNVGGEISSTILYQMNTFGRISVCGAVSSYNASSIPKATIIQRAMVTKQLEMKGFIVTQFADRWMESIEQNLKWIQNGKLKYRETITHEFENTPRALIGVLRGENIGKAVVKVGSADVETHSAGFKDLLHTFEKLGK